MNAAIAVAVLALSAPGGSRAFTRAVLGPEPVRPYVDLGPVLVPEEIDKRSRFDKLLQLEGDRLNADGFFISEGDPTALYAPEMTIPPSWSHSLGPLMVIPMAVTAFLDTPAEKHRAVLRAFTFQDLPQATRQELLRLAAQVVTGEISIATFEAERQRLLVN